MMFGTRLATSTFFLSVIGLVLAVSNRTFHDMLLTVLMSGCAITPLLVPRRKKTYRRRGGSMSARRIRFSSVSQAFVLLEAWLPFIRRARIWNEKKVESNVRPSGNPHDPEKMATFATRAATLLVPVSIIVGVAGFIHLDAAFLAFLAAPTVMYFAPTMRLKLETMERKSRIEEETAYFLSYVNIMQSVNVGLYRAFDMVRGASVFPAMEKDAMEIVKRVELLGFTQNDSLDVYAKTHPSRQFAEFVFGYLAKITSVGNVPGYTESKAKYFFDEYLAVWDRYQKSAQDIFGAILMIALVLPMMMALIGVMGSPGTFGAIILAGSAIPPVVAVLMVVMLNSNQPSTGNTYAMSYMSMLPGLVVGSSALFAGMGAPTATALACFMVGIINYMSTRREARNVAAIDAMMPEFMADIAEMSKAGMNVGQIIQVQAGRKSYRRHFNEILAGMGANIRRGMSFEQAAGHVRSRSKQVKFIMFLLARTYATGGGTRDIFYNMTNFIRTIEQKKRQITGSLSSLTMIVFASPFLMLGISSVMLGMFSGMPAGPDAMDGVPGRLGGPTASMISSIEMMSVITSVSMGVVASKISTYTIKNTLPLAITSLSAILAIHFIPEILGRLGAAV